MQTCAGQDWLAPSQSTSTPRIALQLSKHGEAAVCVLLPGTLLPSLSDVSSSRPTRVDWGWLRDHGRPTARGGTIRAAIEQCHCQCEM